ncbi:mechanosensitive ion channel family protein [Sphaerochaeta halotolerans]|uniref:Mechanosensitive ion channel family protein n=1 Tax=Sphaerochaeta halotolerans TaxID=2293840 RepID=A0A372MFX1_9SPIR|nr:mechanosensitive ion channel family protein [Sphaerochaeta halotolerans]RFU94278.1 mechanosensitive ion channel family protein [Sphaerochaeta halotolerans]
MIANFMALSSEAVAESSAFGRFVEKIDSWIQIGPVEFLVNVVIGLLIVFIGKLVIIGISRVLKRALNRSKKINDLMARFILKLVNVIGWIFLIIAFLGRIGLDMGPVLAGLGITGVVLGFAFQDTIGNLLSGMMIVINSPFRIGDYIETGSFSGTVSDMDMICVILSTPDNRKITISNKLVWGNPIVNYSNVERRRLGLTVSVAYGTNIQLAKDTIWKILNSYSEILPEPAPMVEVNTLAASSIEFAVRPWTKPEDFWKVHWRFQGEIVDRLAEVGISVPFNQLDVHIIDQPKAN